MEFNLKQKVAIITGANKGIGFSLVKNLAKDFDGIVYLTARNHDLGLKAVKELEEQGLSVKYHQLDISDMESIKRLETYMRTTYGGLDILINNAANICNPNSEKQLKTQIEEVVNVNYFGTLNVCNALFPLLRPNARVVNVSSDWGCIYYVKDESFRNKLMNKDSTIDDINSILKEYLESIKKDDYKVKIYDGYKMSKNGINALTRAQQAFFDSSDQNIIVNAVNPGDVKTDMNLGGYLTPDQATETILFLVKTTDKQIPRGEFWYQMKNYNWDDLNLDLKAIFGDIFEFENVNIR